MKRFSIYWKLRGLLVLVDSNILWCSFSWYGFKHSKKYTTSEFSLKIKESEIFNSIKNAEFCNSKWESSEDFYYISDWSFISQNMYGDNWFLLGDAAGFVDPILSGWASFAMEKAIFLWKILNLVDKNPDVQEILKQKYEAKYKHDIVNYLKMAYAWYKTGNANKNG